MELRVLGYFLAAAREENITKAAALLHITQPTLSRQLMQLEEELGVKLFKRTNHRIELTAQGLLLKRRAQELLSLAEKTRQELNQESQLAGEIFIGSGEYQNSRILAEMMSGFYKQYPEVTFNVYSGNSDNIKERIERGLLDIGFLLEPVEVSRYEVLPSPLKEEWGILVAQDSDLTDRDYVSPKDLAGRGLILTRRDLIKKEIVNWFGAYGAAFHVVASGNLPYNLAAMCRKNMGIFLNLKLDCSYEGLKYIPLLPKLESRTVLVWKKNQTMSPTVRAFIKFAQQFMKNLKNEN